MENALNFIVLGDTQRTGLLERWLFGWDQNDRERTLIFSSIFKCNPAFIAIVGDIVERGSSKKAWHYFDSLSKQTGIENIPIYPCLGNHDYRFSKTKSLGYLRERFPCLNSTSWHSLTFSGLGFIFLDSNRFRLSKSEWLEQSQWYEKSLETFEQNPRIHTVYVFTHHPPFTNSLRVSDNKAVQRTFVQPFLKYKKTRAFFSGHNHSYERFEKGGKGFFVTGGGGGPRFLNKKSPNGLHNDLYQDTEPRPFHYIQVSELQNQTRFSIHGLKKSGDCITELEQIEVNK